jgi:hypothetical protein
VIQRQQQQQLAAEIIPSGFQTFGFYSIPLFQLSLIQIARTVRASQTANAAATMHQRHMAGLIDPA